MEQPAQPITIYRHPLSGHSHRVELLIALMGLPVTKIDVDVPNRAHKLPSFLALNPLGQIPVLVDGPVTLFDSVAMLVYLAQRYGEDHWMPQDSLGAAHMQQWFSLAQGAIFNGPAAARRATVWQGRPAAEDVVKASEELLQIIDGLLAGGGFALGGDRPTLADIAAYSYIAKAPEGAVSLMPYANVRAWLSKMEDLPGFLPFQSSKAGLLAN